MITQEQAEEIKKLNERAEQEKQFYAKKNERIEVLKQKHAQRINDQEFYDRIFTLPYWVKTGDDVLKFLAHIQYRLIQKEIMLSYALTKAKMDAYEGQEFDDLYMVIDEMWLSRPSKEKFEKFEDIIEARKNRQ